MVQKNTGLTRLSLGKALSVLMALLLVSSALFFYTRGNNTVYAAPTSDSLNFQARIANANGSSVPDGNYHIEFKLYDGGTQGGAAGSGEANAGTLLWTETRTTGNLVRVVNGYFSVTLGSVTAFPSTINWDQQLWLTMNVGGTGGAASFDGEMLAPGSKRTKLTAVPYAFSAGQLAKTSGANRGTLSFNTVANNPVITLPDATGTVCLQGSAACNFAAGSGDADYIQNGTTLQTSANFNIQSAAAGSVGGIIRGAVSQTANLIEAQSSGGGLQFSVGSAGAIYSQSGITAYSTGGTGLFGGATSVARTNFGTVLSSSIGVSIQAVASQSADLLQVQNSSSTVLSGVDASGNFYLSAGQSLKVAGSTSFPASPTEGQVYYRTDTKQLYVYANGKWQADRSTATVIVGTSATGGTSNAVDSKLADGADFVNTSTTSAQTVINSAIAALPATGGSVYLMEGTYIVDGSINLPNNTTLIGAGNNTVIKVKNSHNAVISVITNTDTTTGAGVTIKYLRIDGNKANQTAGTQDGIRLNGVGSSGATPRTGASVTGVTVQNMFTAGIYALASSGGTFTNNTISGGTNGIVLDSASNENKVVGNTVSDNTGNAIVASSSSGNTISSNIVRDNGVGIFVFFNSNNNTITGNTLQRSTGTTAGGIQISTTSNNNTITGNTVEGGAGDGIGVASSNGNLISGNRIHNNGGNTTNDGVYLTASDSNTITSNDITDTSCTTNCYAINIFNSTSDTNYLADNRFSSSAGSPTINDVGTGTIYANQARAVNGGQLTVRTTNDSSAFQLQNATGTALLNFSSDTATAAITVTATAGSSQKTLIVNNSTSTGNILEVQDNGTVVFTIADGGAITATGLTTLNGGLTLEAGDNFIINGDTLTDLTGSGLTVVSGALTVDATSATGFFRNGGNSFGVAATLGTNDGFDLNLETGGTTRLTIAAGGNVGIGTTIPTNTLSVSPLQYSTGTASQSTTTVTGTGTTFTAAMVGSEIIFADGNKATITAFVSATSLTVTPSQTVASQVYRIHHAGLQVTSTAKVGIGTSTPTSQLQVNSTDSSRIATFQKDGLDVFNIFSSGTVQLQNSTDDVAGLTVRTASGTRVLVVDTLNQRVGIGTSLPTNTFSVSPIQDNVGTASTGGVASTTVTGTGTSWTAALVGSEFIISNTQKATVTAVASTTSLTVSSPLTIPAGSTYRIHYIGLQVTSSGNVGIGEVNPLFPLQITKNQNAGTVAVIDNTDAGTGSNVGLITRNGTNVNDGTFFGTTGTGYTTSGTVLQDSGAIITGSNLSGGLSIGTRTDSSIRFATNGDANERLRINGNGNVSIGNTNNTYKLDVSGALRLQPNAAPTAAQGVIYFDSTANKFKCSENGTSFVDCIGAGGGGGVTSIGAIDSQSKSANGAVISGTTLYLQNADASFPGLVNTSTQTFAGAKTFNGVVTLASAGTALVVTNSASIGNTLTIGTASTTNGTVVFNNSANANTLTLQSGTTGTSYTLILPTANGSSGQCLETAGAGGQLSFGNCGGGGGGANANKSLSNLTAPTAINQNLLAGAAGGVSLGSATFPFSTLSLAGTSGTPGTNNFTITGVATAGRTLTLPDATGTICLTTTCAGVSTIGTIDSQTKSANGAVISGSSLFLQNADASFPGLVSTGAQTFAGNKTFNDNLGVGVASSTPRLLIGGTISAGDSIAKINSTINTTGTNLVGFTFQPTLSPSTTFGAIGQYIDPIVNVAAGVTAQFYTGIEIASPTKTGTGTITNAHQLLISESTIGTTNYSLYVAGGSSVLNGAVAIGSSTNPSGVQLNVDTDPGQNRVALRVDQEDTTNNNAAVVVTNAGTGTTLLISDEASSGDTTPFIIDADGKVGIGTATPGGLLEIKGASAAALKVTTAGGTSLLVADTSSSLVGIGSNGTVAGFKLAINSSSAGGILVSSTSAGSKLLSLQNNTTETFGVSITGVATFKNVTDSTSAFLIQNLASDTLLKADTTNNRLVVGNATASASADSTLFVVDSATTALAPVGVNGGIFYDTTLSKFRCYQAGAYTDCIGGGSGVTTVGTIDSQTKSANGAVISGTSLVLQNADASFPGLVSTSTQTFAGAKTFNSGVVLAAQQTISLTGGTTAQRPASPTEGMVYYDTTTKQLLTYANGKWQSDRSNSTYIVAATNSVNLAGADYTADGNTAAAADGDQVQINQALTAAGTAGGGTVYLMEGTYTVDAAISIPNNVTLAGAGNGTIITIPNSFSASIKIVTNTDVTTGARVGIRDLRIDGNKANQTAGAIYGIYVDSVGLASNATAAEGVNINSVIVQSTRSAGIYFNFSSNGRVVDSSIKDSEYGIQANSLLRTSINNNTIYGSTLDGINLTGDYTVISNNKIASSTNYGIQQRGGSRISISGNKLLDNGYGIGLTLNGGTGASYTTVDNNVVYNSSIYGIHIDASSNNTITNNVVNETGTNTANNALYLSNASSNNTITGNRLNDSNCTVTCYSINISHVAAASNYLSNNQFVATQTASINDISTTTVYANQSRGINGGQLTTRTANDTAAFQIQNAAGNSLLTVDSTNGEIEIGKAGASGIDGKLVIYNSSNANTLTLKSGVTTASYTLELPTTIGASGDCIKANAPVGSVISTTFGACAGAGGTGTLQGAYDNDTDGGNAIVNLNSTDGSIIFRDASTPLSGDLFAIQNNAGTATFLGVSSSAVNFKDSSGNNAFLFDSTTSRLRIYGDTTTPTNYAEIYYDNTNSQAVFAASTGTTRIGSGTGNVTVPLTGQNDAFIYSKTYTPSAAYTNNDFTVTRNLTSAANNAAGSVAKIEDLSTGSSVNPNLLLLNQSNSAATGFLIKGQRAGSDVFTVSDSGAVVAASFATTGQVTAQSLLVQDATTNQSLVFNTSDNHLKIYENIASPLRFVDIYYDNATSSAIIAASSGTTQIGTGSGGGGNINLLLSGAADQLLTSKTNTPGAAYSLSDFNFTRTITGAGNAITGSVIKVEDLSTFTAGGSVAPNVLLINQNNTSAGGNLILAQTGGGANDKFKVDTAGTVTIASGQSYTGAGAVTLQSAAATSLTVDSGTTGALNVGTGASAKTITIGTTTGAVAQVINIGNNATAGSLDTINIGSAIGASVTTIQAGTGGVVIKPITANTAAFTLQDSGAQKFLILDTSNDRLQIGDTVADTTGVLLVLDTKTDVGDPTGVDGAMYYNSNAGKFRCYQAGAWTDCLSYRRLVTLGADVASTAVIACQDVTGLSFPVTAGVTYRFSAKLWTTASVATIGAGFGINGPAATSLSYTVNLASGAAATTVRNEATINTCTVSAASATTTGNFNTFEGVYTPSTSGTAQIRFSPETATASGTVVKAGSTLELW